MLSAACVLQAGAGLYPTSWLVGAMLSELRVMVKRFSLVEKTLFRRGAMRSCIF